MHPNKVEVIILGNIRIGFGIADELIAQSAKVEITVKNQYAVKVMRMVNVV